MSSSCLLRAAPLAVWGHHLSDEELKDAVTEEVTLTHTNELAIEACVCYTLLIKYLIRTNGDRNDALEFVHQYAILNGYKQIIELISRAHKTRGNIVTVCTENPESFEHGFVWGIHFIDSGYEFTEALSIFHS